MCLNTKDALICVVFFETSQKGDIFTSSVCADVAIDWIFLLLMMIVGIFPLLSMIKLVKIMPFIV